MEQRHEGGFREKLERATEDLHARSRRETSKEIFRERELEYQKDTRADCFEGPHGASPPEPCCPAEPCCSAEPRCSAEQQTVSRIDEITKTIHRVEIKEEPSRLGREGSVVHKKRIAVCICSCVTAIAVCTAGLSLHYHKELELERMRLLERVGSHAQCREEKTALEARLAMLENRLAAAEREADIQTGNAMRLHAELAESRAELHRTIQALEAMREAGK